MHTYIYICTYIHTYMHAYVRAYVRTCMHTSIQEHLHVHICAYIHASMYACIPVLRLDTHDGHEQQLITCQPCWLKPLACSCLVDFAEVAAFDSSWLHFKKSAYPNPAAGDLVQIVGLWRCGRFWPSPSLPACRVRQHSTIPGASQHHGGDRQTPFHNRA